MDEFRIRLATIHPGSIGAMFRDARTRFAARLTETLAVAKEKLAAALRSVKELLVLPPQPIEGTCVVVSELSARFLGTVVLGVALGLPQHVALLLALAATLLSARHVMSGYFANRILRETGELLSGMFSP